MVRSSNFILNKSSVSILVLFLIWEECFQLFTVEHDVSSGLVIHCLDYVEVYFHYIFFVEKLFYLKWILIISKFFCVCWHCHIIIHFVNALYPISMTHPTWSRCMITLMHCWIQLHSYFVKEFLHVWVSKIYTCIFLVCAVYFCFIPPFIFY